MRRFGVAAFVTMACLGVLTSAAAAAAPTVAQPAQPARIAPASTARTMPEAPVLVPVKCPMCIVAATVLVRAAVAVRAARTARAVVITARALSASSRGLIRTTRARVSAVSRESRRVASRGARWTKRNWPKLRYDTRSCLTTYGVLKAKKFLVDGKVTYEEFSSYVLFGGGWLQYPPGSTWEIRFPLKVDASDLRGEAQDIAFSCAVGMGVAKYWKSKTGGRPE